jgi:acetyl esterase/lipase
MRIKLMFAVLALVASAAATAATHSGSFTRLEVDMPTDTFCNGAAGTYANPLPADMCYRMDVAYGSDALQKLDVYMPSQTAHNAPIIVMVHGGGWYQGDKFDNPVVRNKVEYWVRRGVIFISVNYPLVPNSDPLQQARSVAQGLGYAQKHAAEWGGDSRKVILMGFSAGGHLVSLLAAQPRLATSMGARSWLGTVVLDSAAYDVPSIMNNPYHDPIFDNAFGTNPKYWTATSPMAQMRSRIAPFLAVCSSLEGGGSCTRAQAFVDKALGYGTDAMVVQEGLEHDDINDKLGLLPDYTDEVNTFMTALYNGTLK